jgi:hypothetical protein
MRSTPVHQGAVVGFGTAEGLQNSGATAATSSGTLLRGGRKRWMMVSEPNTVSTTVCRYFLYPGRRSLARLDLTL